MPARWAGPFLIVLILILYNWKLVLTNQFTWLAADDITNMVLPWFQFQASEWKAGRFPLWDPYEWSGQPLLAQAQPGATNPLNWLLFLAPLKNTWLRQAALHWYYVLIRVLAALSFYWLCRDLGRSRIAALFAGVVYGTAGYVGSIDQPQMVVGGMWAPPALMFQFRAIRGLRPVPSAIFGGFFLGLVWLSGHHQLPLYVSLACGFIWLYVIFNDRSQWKQAAWFLLTAFLVSAVLILPTAEYGRLAVRWSGADHALEWHETVPYDVHQLYSLRPLSLWSVLVPGTDLNANPFLGAVAVALAGVGLLAAWRDPRVRIFAAMMLGAVAFALGPGSMIHGWFYALVPLVDKARVPSQALIVFHLGACALVAWGIDHFTALSRRWAAWVACAAAAFGLALGFAGLILLLTRTLALTSDARFMVTAFASAVAGGVLWALWNGALAPRPASAILLAMALIEIGNTGGNYTFAGYHLRERTSNLRRMAEDADIFDYLRNAPGHPFRVDYDGEAFPHNIGDWWGVEAFSANVASAPSIVMRNDPYSPRVQAMMGVRYYLGTKPLREGQQEVFTGASGRKVYRNPTAFPRAWAVHSTERVAGSETARRLGDPSFDLARRALVTREHPPLEECGGDSVRVAGHEPGRVVLEAQMRCRGMVILSETYFPGWRATVDGRSTAIYAANGFVRGVVVEQGVHRIEMVYRPASVMVGALLTLAGLLLAAAAWWFGRRPRADILGAA